MKTNVLVDTSTLEVIKKMDKEMGYDFIVGLLEYGLYGKEPQFKELALQLAFIPLKNKIDFNVQRYENCVSNGEKGKEYGVQGAEYGKLGGRPRKEETKEEYTERKKEESVKMTEKTDTRPNCQITPKESEREKWAERAKNNFKGDSEIQTPIETEKTQNNHLSVPNKGTSLEEIFRNKIRENKQENIKWIIKYDTFMDCLIENPDLVEWATENDYNGEELEKIWNKFKENYNKQIKR